MSANELQPDVDEVLQAEPSGTEPTVKVAQQGPTRTQVLPRKAGAVFTRVIGTTAKRLVGADHRRASVMILAEADIWIAFSQAGIDSAIASPTNNQAFKHLAIAPPFTVEATVEVWAIAVTGTATVSVKTELWAAGEGDD